MTILDSLPHRCDGYVRARASDEWGGSVDVYELVWMDRPCWIQGAGDNEIKEFAKRGMVVSDKVYFTSKPEIDEKHQLEIDGIRYDVKSRAVPDASVGLGIVWRVMLGASTTEGTVV